ncbi:SAM-dependent methyltransferase [Pseudomonas phage vB_PpuP-Vasula]
MSYMNVIASAFRQDKAPASNAMNTVESVRFLEEVTGQHVEMVLGSWKEEGQQEAALEASMMVAVHPANIHQVACYFLQDLLQDAILVIDPTTDMASLWSLDGGYVVNTEIGKWQQIDREEALQSECYTLIGNSFWVAK